MIKVIDFLKDPHGDTREEGIAFFNETLYPAFCIAREKGEVLTVSLDGAFGYMPQFLRGAFVEGFTCSYRDFTHTIKIVTQDQPGLLDDIKKYWQQKK